jgi:hypothetical protein
MPTTTLFTWGYYGWGNATPQLVEAVDAVEHSRGFAPPLFVDIRIRRSVRAILDLAERRFQAGGALTSEDLQELDFMAAVRPAARSKRLTELCARRLLAFRENLQKPRERLFVPAWRL